MGTNKSGDSAGQQAADIRRRAAAAKVARTAGAKRPPPGKSATALTRDAKAWQAGAVGEERVGRQLARLDRTEAIVLDDRLLAPPKLWNLDHLVVALSGVYFVDAKNWRGDLTVFKGGLWRHWNAGPVTGRKSENMGKEVAKVAGMSAQAATRLGWPVQSVICLAGSRAREFDGAQTVNSVTVIAADRLVRWIREQPQAIRQQDLRVLGDRAAQVFPPATPDAPLSDFQRRLNG